MKKYVRAHGKCILAGEHSVVRGGEALVFPLESRWLELAWEKGPGQGWSVDEAGLEAPLQKSLQTALNVLGREPPAGHFHLHLRSTIPLRAGLGSSAALAVVVVRFLESEGLAIADPFALALAIENLFHGTSSGIDVACALASRPIQFRRGKEPQPLRMAWQPLLYLCDTGLRSSTKECVEKVSAAKRPDLDARMHEAVRQAKAALQSEEKSRLPQLAQALEIAASCFTEWGLGAPQPLVRTLQEKGALAVKPTGSGGGGFLLSLWEKPPPAHLELIPVTADSSQAL